jgi:hypothetical protein
MEPVFRPFCPSFHTPPTFITRSFRNFKASARHITVYGETADRSFRATKDVPVLRVNHFTLERILPRVWQIVSSRVPMVKRCEGIKL